MEKIKNKIKNKIIKIIEKKVSLISTTNKTIETIQRQRIKQKEKITI